MAIVDHRFGKAPPGSRGDRRYRMRRPSVRHVWCGRRGDWFGHAPRGPKARVGQRICGRQSPAGASQLRVRSSPARAGKRRGLAKGPAVDGVRQSPAGATQLRVRSRPERAEGEGWPKDPLSAESGRGNAAAGSVTPGEGLTAIVGHGIGWRQVGREAQPRN
jgi:hypothetical protein